MHDPIATGRRAAMRAAGFAGAAVALVAVAFLVAGLRPALGVAAGGGAMLAGQLASTALALGGGIVPAGAAFARLLLGVLVKWVLVVVVVAVALEAWRLPPLPVLVGLVVGLFAWLLALNLRGANRGSNMGRQG